MTNWQCALVHHTELGALLRLFVSVNDPPIHNMYLIVLFNADVASGGSIDWVAGTTETKVNFGFELRDNGFYGFLLPPDQIIPTAMETLDAVIVILREAKALGYH